MPGNAKAADPPAPAIDLGIGLECGRNEGETLEYALAQAATAGFRYVEPFVYAPVELDLNSHQTVATTSPYHHLHVDRVDRRAVQRAMQAEGLSFSAFDAHTSLLLPQLAVPQLRRVLDLAADLGCPIVMSDEGPVALDWMPLDRAFDVLCFSLEPVLAHARTRGVRFAVELHNALTVRPEYLRRLLARFGVTELGLNFDTGNFFLAGNDPVEFLRHQAASVIHVHLKDIPPSQLDLRGKVTGTRVGVAAGDGVVDIRGVIETLARAGYPGVLSVECDTWDQAKRSRTWLESALARITPATADDGE